MPRAFSATRLQFSATGGASAAEEFIGPLRFVERLDSVFSHTSFSYENDTNHYLPGGYGRLLKACANQRVI